MRQPNNSTKVSKKTLKSKAYKKKLSRSLAVALATSVVEPDVFELGVRTQNPMKKAYWNTYYCNDTITVENGIMNANHCKNRWCLVCQSIKMANIANGYGPQIEAMDDPYFVTLTAPTVLDWALEANIKLFLNSWRSIMKEAARPATKRSLRGLRKSECTVRPGGLYHFHFHVIIDGRENAEWLVERWIYTMPNTDPRAQDVRPVDRSKPIMDMFKYFTKLTTKINKHKGADMLPNPSETRAFVDPKRLHVIFQNFKGLRVFQPFGSMRKINEDRKQKECGVLDGRYNWYETDWFNINEGLALSDAIIKE